jgi:hypothetical protein
MDNEKVLSSDLGDLPKSEESQIEHQIGEIQEGIVAENDPYLSNKLDHKFDRHIVPWIFGIW